MKKQRQRSPKPFRLCIGNDPTLWRYESAQAALAANCDAVARLILAGKYHQEAFEIPHEKEVVVESTN